MGDWRSMVTQNVHLSRRNTSLTIELNVGHFSITVSIVVGSCERRGVQLLLFTVVVIEEKKYFSVSSESERKNFEFHGL